MYFLTILASLSLSTIVPRASRMNFACRLIMPCRLPWAAAFTLPVPVTLKRFLAPLLVFILGILLSLSWKAARKPRRKTAGRTQHLAQGRGQRDAFCGNRG